VAVWRRTGEFLRLFAKKGDGPGELRGRPQILVDHWDSIHVRHAGGSRWSVFDPHFNYARILLGQVRIIDPQRTLFTPTGEAITAFVWPGWPVPEHVYEVVAREGGKVIRGFGTPGPEEGQPRRLLTRGSDSTFWAIPDHRYRAEEWTFSGILLRTVERHADWFDREDDSFWDSTKESALPTEIKGIHFDEENGFLWTLVLVPDLSAPSFDPTRGYRTSQFEDYFDLIVEVLDVESQKVLASWRADGLDDSISGFLSDGRAFRRLIGPLGLTSYEILELRVVKLMP
jgi:hypothetical protein